MNSMYNEYSMMNPGGPGGVSITGKWINKRTGKTIYVRDNIIGEQGMQVRCSDGSFINMSDFSRDYIQASDELYDEQGNVVGTVDKTNGNDLLYDLTGAKPIKQETDNSIKNENVNYISTQTQIETNVSSNSALIEKVFSKLTSIPTIDLTINWADFPQQELNTLINFLDVTQEDIAEYVYNHYVNKDAIKEQVISFINNQCK